jgi:type I restriction enzyme S subunit
MSFKIVSLGDIATVTRDTVDPRSLALDTLYVGLENIGRGGTFTNVKTVADVKPVSTKFRFTEDQVLYGKLRPYLAKVARPDFGGICSTDILPIMPGEQLDRDYLAHFLLRPESKHSAGAL